MAKTEDKIRDKLISKKLLKLIIKESRKNKCTVSNTCIESFVTGIFNLIYYGTNKENNYETLTFQCMKYHNYDILQFPIILKAFYDVNEVRSRVEIDLDTVKELDREYSLSN